MRPWGYLLLVVAALVARGQTAAKFGLHELDLSAMTPGTGRGMAVANRSASGGELRIGGEKFARGIGTRAFSTLMVELDGRAVVLTGRAGPDDTAKAATVRLHVLGDRRVLWDSGVMRAGDKARPFSINLEGVRVLAFLTTDAGDGSRQDFADWVDVDIAYRGQAPVAASWLKERPYLLTPPAPAAPRINGPKLTGVRPGAPFLFRIPCTGERPMAFSATDLPAGLQLDATTGILRGRAPERGTHRVLLHARNRHGEVTRPFAIVAGDRLALTPSMGWNSWYLHKRTITDAIMRQAADAMITSGMADYGYEYVNVDDCWTVLANSTDPVMGGPLRDAAGRLRTNGHFPDMKALADYIHGKGLKAGLYSSPGPTTCGGFAGSHEHEAIDAQTFAEWGYDYLKYDWCSYEKIARDHSLAELKAPFERMRTQLLKQSRDIQFNLCQYGMGAVWEWGAALGESWRTTDDIAWNDHRAMPGFFYVGRSNAQHWEYAGPGKWNDPDYLLLGYLRDPLRKNEVFPADLSPSENYFYMSMWTMMASPLFFGGDMARLDDFLLNVLCNHEVIDVNLDPLGRQARIVREQHNQMIMLKELEDGSKAVGLFHITGAVDDPVGFALGKQKQLEKVPHHIIPQDMGDPVSYIDWGEPVRISVSAEELGITGRFAVRDLWRQKDLGEFTHSFAATVPFHGVALLKFTPVR